MLKQLAVAGSILLLLGLNVVVGFGNNIPDGGIEADPFDDLGFDLSGQSIPASQWRSAVGQVPSSIFILPRWSTCTISAGGDWPTALQDYQGAVVYPGSKDDLTDDLRQWADRRGIMFDSEAHFTPVSAADAGPLKLVVESSGKIISSEQGWPDPK